MNVMELQNEIDRLREDLISARNERDKLTDERDDILHQYEEEYEQRKLAMDQSIREQVEDAKAPLQEEIEHLKKELDWMNRASVGDPCGWREDKRKVVGPSSDDDDHEGTPVITYINDETGETATEMPRILQFSTQVQRIGKMEEDQAKLEKTQRKAKEEEASRRKLEVKMNDARREVASLTRMVRSWESTSVALKKILQVYAVEMNKSETKLQYTQAKLEEFQNKLEQERKNVDALCVDMGVKIETIADQQASIQQLEESVNQLTSDRDAALQRLQYLEQHIAEEVASKVAPIHLDIANANALLMHEKSERIMEYIHLADLWPAGWSMPSILSKYRVQDNDEDVEKRRAIAIERELLLGEKKGKEQNDIGEGATEWEVESDRVLSKTEGAPQILMEGEASVNNDVHNGECSNNNGKLGQGHNCPSCTNDLSVNKMIHDARNSTPGTSLNACALTKTEIEAARDIILYIKSWNFKNKDGGSQLWYDMQTVEEIAAGDNGWKPTDDMIIKYQVHHLNEKNGACDESNSNSLGDKETSLSMPELREKIYQYAKSEIELQNDLGKVRHQLAIFSHHLIDLVETQQDSEENNDSHHVSGNDTECIDSVASNKSISEGTIIHEPTVPPVEGIGQQSELLKIKGGQKTSIGQTTNYLNNERGKYVDRNNESVDCELTKCFPQGNIPDKVVWILASKAVWSGFTGQSLKSSSASNDIIDENARWVASIFLGVNRQESSMGMRESNGGPESNFKLATNEKSVPYMSYENDWDSILNDILPAEKQPETIDVGSFLTKQTNLDDLVDIITLRDTENNHQSSHEDDALSAINMRGYADGENAILISTNGDANAFHTGKGGISRSIENRDNPIQEEYSYENQNEKLSGSTGSNIDALNSIYEEATLHDKMRKKLFLEGDRLKQILIQDHSGTNSALQVAIEKSEKEVKRVSVQIISMQKNIAGMEGKIRGLSIAAAKPRPPKKPPPLKVISMPSNRFSEAGRQDDTNEDEEDLLSEEYFEGYLRRLKGIEQENALLPPDKVITSSQEEIIRCAIDEENKKLRMLHERLVQQYEQSKVVFQEEMDAYEASETERLNNLTESKNQLLLLETELLYLRDLKSAHESEQHRLVLDMNNEKKSWDSLQSIFNDASTFKCKLLLEAQQGVDNITTLQDQLHDAILQHKMALELPLASTSFIGHVELGKQRDNSVACIEKKIISLRHSLIEEGRRRRALYEEELSVARRMVSVLREEKSLSEERSLLATILKGLFEKKLTAMDQMHIASNENNLPENNSANSNSNEGGISDSDIPKTKAEVDLVNHILEAAQTLRGISVNKHVVTDVLDSIRTERTWLPEAEKERFKEKVEHLESLLFQSTSALRNQASNEKIKLGLLEEQNSNLKSRVEQIERNRESDLKVVRQMVDASVQMLKERADDMAEAFQAKEKIYRNKMIRLTGKMRRDKNELSKTIAGLKNKLSATSNIATAMRYELSMFHVKEDLTRVELERMKEIWIKDGGDLKEQLKTERQHSARLELIIEALKEQIHKHASEIKVQEQMALQKEERFRLSIQKMQHELWREHFAIYSVGMNVDALFVFFVERLANLAGSKKEYNDALRENGAIEIAAVMCRGTREELRIPALKLLAGMCWNKCVQKRMLGWDVIHSWRIWTQRVVHAEELRIRKLRKTLDNDVTIETTLDEDAISKVVKISDEVKSLPKYLMMERIRERRRWAIRRQKWRESPNRQNQVVIGSNKDLVAMLLDICTSSNKEMAKDALFSLTATSFDENSADKLGNVYDFVSNILKLCQSSNKAICSQAVVLIGNLSLNNKRNQDFIGTNGGIKILMNLCKEQNMDLLEGASAALANLVCNNPHNSRALIELGGINALLNSITDTSVVNFLDENQNEEVQANLVECLANLSISNDNIGERDKMTVDDVKDLILLCGSQNTQVQKMAGMVIGIMARDPTFRYEIGMGGGVEALLLLCEKNDDFVRANSFWGLSNLAWDPSNQERIGRYISQILQACRSSCVTVQMHAMCCLANSLYYNEKNRIRCNYGEGIIDLIHDTCKGNAPSPMLQSVLRMLLSLSYDDEIASKLWEDSFILNQVKLGASADPITQNLSALVLLNLSSHNSLKFKIVQGSWIRLLTDMQKSGCKDVREIAVLVLDELADVQISEEITERKKDIGIEGMIRLCKNGDLMVKKLALDSLAEEIWSNKEKQIEIVKMGGVEIILNICNDTSTTDDLLVSALWVFRNVTYSNTEVKSFFGNSNAVQILIKVITSHRALHPSNSHVLECALTALTNMVIDHEKNCRDLLKDGLDVIIGIANMRNDGGEVASIDRPSKKNLATLATALLHIIRPYSFLICSNCGNKQPTGVVCKMCGRKIRTLIEHKKQKRKNVGDGHDDKENRNIKVLL